MDKKPRKPRIVSASDRDYLVDKNGTFHRLKPKRFKNKKARQRAKVLLGVTR